MKLLGKLALAVATFCSSVSFGQTTVEKIMGFTFDAEGITYQVASGGCTEKEDFRLDQLESYPVQLRLVRVSQDFCEAIMPYGVQFTYTWEEIGLRSSQFVIANEIQEVYYLAGRE